MKRLYFSLIMLMMTITVLAGPNLTNTAVVMASSVTKTDSLQHIPAKVNDGSYSTCWTTDSLGAGEWLLLSWSTPQLLNDIKLAWDVDNYTYAKSFSVYSLDEMPEELRNCPLTAAQLPASAKLVYRQDARELKGTDSEEFYISDVTTRHLLFLFDAPAVEGRPVAVSEIFAWYSEISWMKTVKVSPSMVRMGQATPITFNAYDQNGQQLYENISLSVDDEAGDIANGQLTAKTPGWITLTAFDSSTNAKATSKVYVVGDAVAPAAVAPDVAFASLLPASSGTTVYTGTVGNQSQPADEFALGGNTVKMIWQTGTLAINNASVTCALDGTFSPLNSLYDKLHVELFSPVDASGKLQLLRVGEQAFTLKGGEWKTIEYSVAEAEIMGNLLVSMDAVDGSYPDLLLANVYFTKAPVKMTLLKAEPRIVRMGETTAMHLQATDQLGTVVRENVVYSVPDDSGSTIDKDGKLTATKHGWLTITATDTLTMQTVAANIYVLGDEDAPAAPAEGAVFAGLLPATKGTTVFSGATGNKAQPQDVIRLNGIDVKPVYTLGTLVINNSEVTAAQGGKFNPMDRLYDKLHLELFSPSNVTGKLKVEGVSEKAVTLTGGQWTKIDLSVETSSEMGDIVLSMDMQGNSYPDVLLANIYFTKTAVKIASLTAEPRMVQVGKTTTMQLSARDQFNHLLTDNLVYSVPDGSGATLTKDGKLTATKHGSLTITVRDTLTAQTATASVYVLGNEDAPVAPAEGTVFAGLLPATKGTTVYTAVVGGKAQPQDIVKLNSIDVKPVYSLDTLTISNASVTSALGKKFNPMDCKYETLHLEIFSPTNATGKVKVEGVGEQTVTLTGGQWTKVDFQLANVKEMGNVVVAMDKQSDSYPDVLLANIYFTKTPVKLTSLTAEPRFVQVKKATNMQLTPVDQFGKTITENLVYGIPAGSNATIDENGKLTATKHGWLTITAKDTLTALTASARIYVLGDEDAPAAPDSAAVYAGLLPVTDGVTVYTVTGTTAQPQEIIKLKKMEVKPVYALDTLVVSNSVVASDYGKTFSPVSKFYDKLHFEIFTPADATGKVTVAGVGERALNVTGGKWSKIEMDVSKITSMGNIIVSMTKQGDIYPDALLANIYFTKAKIDSTDFVLATIEAGNAFIPKNKAVDLQLTARNKKGVDLKVYEAYNVKVTYTSDKGTFDAKGLFTATADGPIAIVGSAGEGKWLGRDTIYVETYPNPDSMPALPKDSVMAVYSETYGITTYTASDKTANGGYKAQRELELSATDKAVYAEEAVCFGLKLPVTDLTKCDTLCFSVYSFADQSASFSIDGTTMNKVGFTLKGHQWNHVRLPLTGRRNQASWLQLFVGTTSKKNSVVIDNVYFHRDQLYDIITSFSVGQRLIHKKDTVDLQLSALNYLNADITDDVFIVVDKGKLLSKKKYVTTADGPITVTATGSNGTSYSVVVHTIPARSSIQPEEPSSLVKAIYSDKYGATSYSASGSYTKQYEVQLASGDRAIAALDAVSVSLNLNRLNLSDHIWMKASVYSTEDVSGYVDIEGTSMDRQYFTLNKYQWNEVEVLLTENRSSATALRFVVGSGNQPNTVLIDNVYFVKMSEGSLYVAKQPNSEGFNVVLGTLTDKNKKLLTSDTNIGAYDLRKATIGESIIMLQPDNTNAVILIEGTLEDDGYIDSKMWHKVEGSPNVIVSNGDGTYSALTKIELKDNYYTEKYPVFNKGIIKTGDHGFSYTRTILGESLVTSVLPVSMTLPDGLLVYNMYDYNSDHGITLGLQRTNEVKKHMPYVIRNTTKNNITIKIDQKGNLDMRQSSEGVDALPSGVAMHASYSTFIDTTLAVLNGRFYESVRENNPVPSFRAYFKGLEFRNPSVWLHDGTRELIIADTLDTVDAVRVIGEINGKNRSQVEAIKTTAFDFTATQFADTLTMLNPVNKNAIVFVSGNIDGNGLPSSVIGEQLSKTRNVVVRNSSDSRFAAMRGIELTDDENSPVWRKGSIITGQNGYTYTRVIPARAFTSAAVPADLTLPRGIEVYELMSYSAISGLTINRLVTEKLQKNCPYILYNATDSAITIRAKGTGSLDLRASQEKSTAVVSGSWTVTLHANYGTSRQETLYQLVATPTGNSRGEKGMSRAPKFTLKLERAYAEKPLVAFRAYISGLPTDGSLNVSINDETKKIRFAEALDKQGFMAVKGLISNDSKQQVESFTTIGMAGLDLREAQFDDELLSVAPANPNTLMLMPGTVGEGGVIHAPEASRMTDTRNMVVLGTDGKYYPVKRIIINDSSEAPVWWPDFCIVTNKVGYEYHRIIHPQEITTLCVPLYTELPNGLELYQASGYNANDGMIFAKSPATLISQNQPSLVYNTTDQDIVVSYTIEEEDLCLNHSSERVREIGSTSFRSNFGLLATSATGDVWTFDGGNTPFRSAAGKSVPAFRCYFTGVSESTKVSFTDGSLSGIYDVELGTTNDRDVYYDLQGRRIENGQMVNRHAPGLYIKRSADGRSWGSNGKKMIVK